MCAKVSELQELSNDTLEQLITTKEEYFEEIISFVETIAKELCLPYNRQFSVADEPELCWPEDPHKPEDEYVMKEFHGFTIEYRDWNWKYGKSNTQRCVGLKSKDKRVLHIVYDGASEKGIRIYAGSYYPGRWEEEFAALMKNPAKAIETYRELISQNQFKAKEKQWEKQDARNQKIYEQNRRAQLMDRAEALGLKDK